MRNDYIYSEKHKAFQQVEINTLASALGAVSDEVAFMQKRIHDWYFPGDENVEFPKPQAKNLVVEGLYKGFCAYNN